MLVFFLSLEPEDDGRYGSRNLQAVKYFTDRISDWRVPSSVTKHVHFSSISEIFFLYMIAFSRHLMNVSSAINLNAGMREYSI